jgi:hypothetical protein
VIYGGFVTEKLWSYRRLEELIMVVVMFKTIRVSLNINLNIIIMTVIIAETSIMIRPMIAPIAWGPLCGFVNRCPTWTPRMPRRLTSRAVRVLLPPASGSTSPRAGVRFVVYYHRGGGRWFTGWPV